MHKRRILEGVALFCCVLGDALIAPQTAWVPQGISPTAWAQAPAGNTEAPRLTLGGEEATNVYFDGATLVPQTPILFSANVENPASEARELVLNWKISDANGKKIWERNADFTVQAGASIIRRELFDVPARGGFLLETSVVAKRKGRDLETRAALPFAITLSPVANAPKGIRPRSFFVLGTPTNLSNNSLDLYSRLGARVLRSALPEDPARPDWSSIDSQLGERLKREISTIALLNVGEENSRRSEAFWSRQVPSNLARYNALSTWELAGDLAPADLDAWSQIVRSRRSDVALLAPLPALNFGALPANTTLRSNVIDGATFGWPLADNEQIHPMALRRLWLSRALTARSAGLNAFHLRREDEATAGGAGTLSRDYLSAIMAGASSMSEPLAPPTGNRAGARAMARGVAFAMLSRTLEDAAFREELFPKTPTLEGALFRSQRGSVAVLYAPLQNAKMSLQVSPARVFDLYGNLITTSQNGRLNFNLGADPVYLVAETPTEVLSYGLRAAKIEGLEQLAAQVLPLSRDAGASGPGSASIRLRVQNIGLGTANGQVEMRVPKGWKLAKPKYDLTIAEGESKTFEFRALSTTNDPKWNGNVPIEVRVTGKVKKTWDFNVPTASARSVAPGSAPIIDGELNEWRDANWLRATPNAAGVSAQVAFKWDATYLYIAAKVRESALTPRNPEASSYEFWRGDGIQLAFGTSNGPETVPAREPFRDSDRGFLLSPWGQGDGTSFSGRVLSLWRPDKPYNTIADHVRWGGAVSGAALSIARDETNDNTVYEARLPFSAIPEVNPRTLASRDGVVRFGFIVHNVEGAPLDWGQSVGNFAWWDNTSTFLPEGNLASALRATLGFTQIGDVADAPNTPANPARPNITAPLPTGPSITPVTPRSTPVPTTVPTPRPRPSNGNNSNPIPNLPPPSGPLNPTEPAGVPGFSAPVATPVPAAPTPPETIPPSIPPFVVPPSDTTPPRQLPPSAPQRWK